MVLYYANQLCQTKLPTPTQIIIMPREAPSSVQAPQDMFLRQRSETLFLPDEEECPPPKAEQKLFSEARPALSGGGAGPAWRRVSVLRGS